MPTFKTNKTKRSGELVQASNNPNDYLFASVGKDKDGHKEIRHLDEASNKIIIDNQNILVKCKNGWTKLSVANVKEDEIWNGWNNYFKNTHMLKSQFFRIVAKISYFQWVLPYGFSSSFV